MCDLVRRDSEFGFLRDTEKRTQILGEIFGEILGASPQTLPTLRTPPPPTMQGLSPQAGGGVVTNGIGFLALQILPSTRSPLKRPEPIMPGVRSMSIGRLRPRCDPAAAFPARLRTVTGGLTSPARLVALTRSCQASGRCQSAGNTPGKIRMRR
jgi:hypothetical protein